MLRLFPASRHAPAVSRRAVFETKVTNGDEESKGSSEPWNANSWDCDGAEGWYDENEWCDEWTSEWDGEPGGVSDTLLMLTDTVWDEYEGFEDLHEDKETGDLFDFFWVKRHVWRGR